MSGLLRRPDEADATSVCVSSHSSSDSVLEMKVAFAGGRACVILEVMMVVLLFRRCTSPTLQHYQTHPREPRERLGSLGCLISVVTPFITRHANATGLLKRLTPRQVGS